jgi:hypothetical protein
MALMALPDMEGHPNRLELVLERLGFGPVEELDHGQLVRVHELYKDILAVQLLPAEGELYGFEVRRLGLPEKVIRGTVDPWGRVDLGEGLSASR